MSLQNDAWVTTVRTRPILLILTALLGTAPSGGLRASSLQGASSAPGQDIYQPAFQPAYTESFDHFWNRYLEAEAQGDLEQMERVLDEIHRLRAERNAFTLHDIAQAFSFQGGRHLTRQEIDEAKKDFEIARGLDPTLPAAYLGLARVAGSSGGLGYLTSVGRTLQGFLASFRSPRDSGYARADFCWWVILLLTMVFVLFTLFMLYRHGGLLYHDLWERVSEKVGNVGALAVTLALLMAPMALTFGFAWLFPFWLTLTFAYQSRAERAVSISVLFFLVTVAPLVDVHSKWSQTVGNPVYRSARSSIDGTFEPTDLLVLRRALNDHSQDRDLRFLLATHYRLQGEYELAATLYRGMLERWPDDLAARINLGNIYFAQRDWEGALLEYERAIELSPNSAVAFYNKSLAHAENFEFRDREEARSRAESLDGRRIASHERAAGEYRAVIDVRLQSAQVLAKFYGLREGLHEDPEPLSWATAWWSGKGARFLFGGLVLSGWVLLFQYVFDRRYTRHCRECGMAFCGRCQIGTGRRGLCTQCYHLFIVKDGVSAAARDQKKSQIEATARRHGILFRVLCFVAPGGGHLIDGRTVLGLVLLLAWVGGMLFWVTGSRFYGLPDELAGLGSPLPHYLVLTLMLVILVVANTVGQPERHS